MNSSGVSARFLELFKEKVERKKYELNWDHPLTVNDVIQYVLGPETTRSGRGYIQMLRNTYPKEKTSDLIRRPAEALVLHSSLSEYGKYTYTTVVRNLCDRRKYTYYSFFFH